MMFLLSGSEPSGKRVSSHMRGTHVHHMRLSFRSHIRAEYPEGAEACRELPAHGYSSRTAACQRRDPAEQPDAALSRTVSAGRLAVFCSFELVCPVNSISPGSTCIPQVLSLPFPENHGGTAERTACRTLQRSHFPTGRSGQLTTE